MFEIVVKLKNDWIDLSGVPDVELARALYDWSSGKEEVIRIKTFSFPAADIVNIVVSR